MAKIDNLMQLTPRRLLRLSAEIIVFFALLLAVERFMTRDALRGSAPPLEAVTSGGKVVNLAQLKGKPAVVYFWATWCPICKIEKSTLDGLGQDHPMLTVALQSGDMQTVRKYLDKEHLNWAVAADEQGDIARDWGVQGVPTVFVLDSTGAVRFVTRGYTSAWGLQARLWWASLAS